MSKASQLIADPLRLAAVRQTDLLDTPPEEAFDQLTQMAARFLRVPAAYISLIDEEREFYKSCFGLVDALQVSLTEGRSFCHYAILSSGPLVIPDIEAHPLSTEVPESFLKGVRAFVGIPLRNAEGHCIGSFGAIDASVRHWTAEEIETLEAFGRMTLGEIRLRMALESSRVAMRAREEVLATVAHDLRSPLSAVVLGLALMESEPLSERGRGHLRTSQEVIQSINALVGDLINVSELDSGNLFLTLDTLEASALANDAAAVLRLVAGRHAMPLIVDAPEDLPLVKVDYEKILRVFSNLIGNAIKFSPDGSPIRLKAEKTGDGVRFSVIDHGRGISAEELERVFERFWRADARDPGGLGLGLSIVKAIVAAHRGSIGVSSVPGEGSTFWFTLPAA